MYKRLVIALLMLLLCFSTAYSREIGGSIEKVNPQEGKSIEVIADVSSSDIVQEDREMDENGNIVGDGMDDNEEREYGLDIHVDDSMLDPDGDNLANIEELDIGTDPRNPDSDGDGLLDGEEVKITNTNPSDIDSDNDGINDGLEIEHELNPSLKNNEDDISEILRRAVGSDIPERTEDAVLSEDRSPDFDGDGFVGFPDSFLFIDNFGNPVIEENQIFDLNDDGGIDYSDYYIFIDFFGQDTNEGFDLSSGEVETTEVKIEEGLEIYRCSDGTEFGYCNSEGEVCSGRNLISENTGFELDDDDDKEIIVSAGGYPSDGSGFKGIISAYDNEGNVLDGWPIETETVVFHQPIIADIDSDGISDIIIPEMLSRLHIFNIEGTEIPGWPKYVSTRNIPKEADGFGVWDKFFLSTPSVDDIDNDGLLEIVMGGYDGKVFVWETNGEYKKEALPWPTYMHDYQRTGYYDHSPVVFEPESIRQASRIVNNDDIELSGTLIFNLHKLSGDGSVISLELIGSSDVIIPPRSTLEIDDIFNELDYRIYEPGDYKIIVFLRDDSGQQIRIKEGDLVAEWEFSVKYEQYCIETDQYYWTEFRCPDEKIINGIIRADFINEDSYIGCPDGGISESCHSDCVDYVVNECLGSDTCDFNVHPALCGDSCPGVKKKLILVVECGLDS